MKDFNKNLINGLLFLLAIVFMFYLVSSLTGYKSIIEPFTDTSGVAVPMVAIGVTPSTAEPVQLPMVAGPAQTSVVVVPNQTIERQSVPSSCPPNFDNNGTTCVRQSRSYPLSWILASCPAAYTNNGTACNRPASLEVSPSVLAVCPTGYTNNGISCQNNADSYIKECSIAGGTIFPCREGFTDMGCYCVSTSAGVSTMSLDLATCPAGYIRDGSRCYPRCNLDYVRTGETCVRPESNLAEQYMTCPTNYFRQGTNCFKVCDPEFVVKGNQCESPATSRGPESMTCPATYPELIGARCYGPCPIGTSPLGTSCITRI